MSQQAESIHSGDWAEAVDALYAKSSELIQQARELRKLAEKIINPEEGTTVYVRMYGDGFRVTWSGPLLETATMKPIRLVKGERS